MAAEIQDVRTGQWVPYPQNDFGRGNIRIDGEVYSYEAGKQRYKVGGEAPPVMGGNENEQAYHDAQSQRVRDWYQQYLGRDASEGEIQQWVYDYGWTLDGAEAAIRDSEEAKARAGGGQAGGGAGGGDTGGGDGDWTYGDDAQQAWMAWPGTGTVDEIKAFADAWNKAHPNDQVTLGGSKGEKLTWRGKTYDTVISAGTGGTGKSWTDLSGEGGGAPGTGSGFEVDDSYLAGYPGGPFKPPEGSELPPAFDYPDFKPPEDAKLPPPFEYADFVAPEGSEPPGPFEAPEKFHQPTVAEMENDPSYQFRRDQAMGALQNSASGRGLTNSGGTIYDLLGLASQFAGTEYQNIWDRGFRDWEAVYQTALDEYGSKVRNAGDLFARGLETYNTNRGGAERDYATNLGLSGEALDRAMAEWAANRGNQSDIWNTKRDRAKDIYDRARNEFDADVENYYFNRDSAWDKLYKSAGLGASVTTAP